MYQIGDKVWSIINMFDPPKLTTIIGINVAQSNSNGIIPEYVVQYKHRDFTVRNENVYPTQIDAELYWAILIIDEHRQVEEKLHDMFLTDDFEIAHLKANKIISRYGDEYPHLLLKYL